MYKAITFVTRSLAYGILSMILLCAFLKIPVLAADSAPKDKPQVTQMDSMVVFAEKRKEKVTKVNASVSVKTEDQLNVERIESIDDLSGRFANFHVSSAGGATNSFLSIRGITGQTVPITPSGVGVYVDDVSLLDPLSNLLSSAYFFDLDRIEVLRGPQGTLYGRNAEAGVLVIKTKDPEHKFSSKIMGEAGNYNKYQLNAVLNAPLIKDKIAARVSVAYLNRDGFRDNVYLNNTAANADEFNIRGKLLWDISPVTELLFTAEQNHVRDGAQDMVPFNTAGKDWDPSQVNIDVDGHENRDMTSFSLRAKHQLESFEIVSISAYKKGKESTLGDPDFWKYKSGWADFVLNQKQFTQELRLVSNPNTMPWKWLTGAYFFHNDQDFTSDYHMGPDGVPMEMDMVSKGDGFNQGVAVFGEVERQFESGFRLGGGLRGQYYKDELNSKRTTTAMGMVLDDVSGDASNEYNQLLGKISLGYDISEHTSVYGLVSQGSRAGGIVSLMQTQKMHHYDPEKALNYEIGLKSNLPDELGYFEVSLFMLQIEDLHVSTTGLGGFQYVTNAGKACNIGGEAYTRLNLFKGLTAEAALGYVDARFEEYKDGKMDYKEKRVPRIPDFTGMAALQYRRPVNKDMSFLARTSWHYIGKTYWDLGNQHSEDAHSLVHATLGLEGDWWKAYLWGKNLLDKEYVRTGLMWGDTLVGAYGAPLTFGVTLQMEF